LELSILGVFVIEIVLHIFVYRKLYFQDYWNWGDIFVILSSIAFVLLDILLTSTTAVNGILSIRGIFNILRIFVLVRKLNVVRVRREVRKKTETGLGYDLKSPLEKVLEILNDIRD
jgi:hypothetical protein